MEVRGLQGPSGRVWITEYVIPTPDFELRTLQPVSSHYTDYAMSPRRTLLRRKIIGEGKGMNSRGGQTVFTSGEEIDLEASVVDKVHMNRFHLCSVFLPKSASCTNKRCSLNENTATESSIVDWLHMKLWGSRNISDKKRKWYVVQPKSSRNLNAAA